MRKTKSGNGIGLWILAVAISAGLPGTNALGQVMGEPVAPAPVPVPVPAPVPDPAPMPAPAP
ncbi:MAG: hydrolase, partial [Planctomycetota bacterium]